MAESRNEASDVFQPLYNAGMEPITLKLTLEGLSKADLESSLDEIVGKGGYTLAEEAKPAGFEDEDLGYSPAVEFLVTLASGAAANVLANLLSAELERIRKRGKKD